MFSYRQPVGRATRASIATSAVDEMAKLLEDVSIQEELPNQYSGKLSEEFDVVVCIEEVACTYLAAELREFAAWLHNTVRKVIHLVNNMYFAMYAEKAPRFSDADLELAQRHAIANIPMDLSENAPSVTLEAAHRTARAASNILIDASDNIGFVSSEFYKQNPKNTEQRKRTRKTAAKLCSLLQNIVHSLDKCRSRPRLPSAPHEASGDAGLHSSSMNSVAYPGNPATASSFGFVETPANTEWTVYKVPPLATQKSPVADIEYSDLTLTQRKNYERIANQAWQRARDNCADANRPGNPGNSADPSVSTSRKKTKSNRPGR